MSAATLETIQSLSASEQEEILPRIRWTRDDCRFMVESGLLTEGTFELIGGDIVPKMTQHERHVFTCKLVRNALEPIFGEDYVRMAAPIALENFEEPEPDAAVVIYTGREYLVLGTPKPEEVRLTVEVSDSTLLGDLTLKKTKYGRAGIRDYWVVDIPNRLLHVFREPIADGYASETIVTPDGAISPLASPESPICVADILP